MKWTLGQIVCVALAVLLAGVLIYHAPFEAAAAVAASASQVVYAPIFDPPVIGVVAGRLDVPVLLIELAFVVFVGGAIFFAASQNKTNKKRGN